MDVDAVINDAIARSGQPWSRDQVRWYSWPQVWPNTSGIIGGAGGQVITTTQILAVLTEDNCYVYQNGSFVYQLEVRVAGVCIREMKFPTKHELELLTNRSV